MRFGGYIIGLRQALFPCRPLGQTARSGGCSAQVMEAHIQKNVFVIVFGFGSVTSMLQSFSFCNMTKVLRSGVFTPEAGYMRG